LINVYVANLGKYNECEGIGDWIQLPATEDEINELFVKIKLGKMVDDEYVHGYEEDGRLYEEYAIHDSECDIDGVEIGEYSSLTTLNELAEKLEGVNEEELNLINESVGNLEESIDIWRKGEFTVIQGVHNKEDLGQEYINEMYGNISELGRETLERYFNYEEYANDCLDDFVMGEDKALEVHNR
jgi:hypothetical protein